MTAVLPQNDGLVLGAGHNGVLSMLAQHPDDAVLLAQLGHHGMVRYWVAVAPVSKAYQSVS